MRIAEPGNRLDDMRRVLVAEDAAHPDDTNRIVQTVIRLLPQHLAIEYVVADLNPLDSQSIEIRQDRLIDRHYEIGVPQGGALEVLVERVVPLLLRREIVPLNPADRVHV